MSLYLDLKYINLIANKLEFFKKRNSNVFNFRCPLCGDSQSKRNKARGYFYQVPNKNEMSMKCHNCGASMFFGNFLKQFDPSQYGTYTIEKFKESSESPIKNKERLPKINFKVDQKKLNKEHTLLDKLLDRLDTLDDKNEAVQFCLKRKIPTEKFNRLYYIDDISKIQQLSEKYRNKIETKEPRLVIPAYNEQGILEGVTCRALRGESLRYLTVKVKDDAQMIFGLEYINKGKKVYAVEGPLDSLFISNAIAVGGTSFGKVGTLGIPKERLTIVLDNQPRNKEVCQMYKKYIDANYNICIWPQTLEAKDINDIVLSGLTPRKAQAIIDENTYCGLEAMLKFVSWSRCNV